MNAEGVALQIRCTGCGNRYVYQGDFRLRTVTTPNMRIRDLQFALRCKVFRARGEVEMTIPQTVIDDVRRTANPVSPLSKAGPPLWRW